VTDKTSSSSTAFIPEGLNLSEFTLKTPTEIGYILRQLSQKHDLITISFDAGKHSFISTIIEADNKNRRFWFDVSNVPSLNESLLGSKRNIFVATPEGVKVQFSVNGHCHQTTYDGNEVFESAYPEELIKLQRRDAFRLSAPLSRPMHCQFAYSSNKTLDLLVRDISIGGIGLWLPLKSPKIEQMDVYPGCRVNLGNTFGVLEASLEIRSKRQVNHRGGPEYLLGCRFVNLASNTENSIQRFIAQLERERHQLAKK